MQNCLLLTEQGFFVPLGAETNFLTYIDMKVGNLHGKRVHYLSFQWDVENFFARTQKYHKITFNSPKFIFEGCEWHILLCFNDPLSATSGNVGLYLERLDYVVERHHVSYTIGIKNKDGTTYRSKKCCFFFDEIKTTFGYTAIATKIDILNDQSKLDTEGSLTVFIEDFELLDRTVHNDGDGEKSATRTVECKDFMKTNYEYDSEEDDVYYADDIYNSNSDSDVEGKNVLQKQLKDLFRKQENCDVTFIVEDQKIHAHRAILIARSPVFNAMFTHNMLEKNTGIVNIPDCSAQAFYKLLQYLYSGFVYFTPEVIAFDLYEASVKYNLEHLRKKCIKVIKMTVSIDNFFDMLAIALTYNEIQLINFATIFFAVHMKHIMLTLEWRNFLKDNHIAANELLLNAMEKNYVF